MNRIIILLLLLCCNICANDFSFDLIKEDILKNKSKFEEDLNIKEQIYFNKDLFALLNGQEPQNKARFCGEFINIYKSVKRFNLCLYDTLFVMPIVKMLCFEPQESSSISAYALKALIDEPQPSYLFSLSDSIKPYVKCFSGNGNLKKYLLSYLKLDENEREEVLKKENSRNVPIAVQVRLGDKVAEQKLIEMYNKEQNYRNKKDLVKELFRAGTDACLKNLIIKFNEPMYDFGLNCVCESIRYPIILEFRRMFPEDSIFHEPFQSVNKLRIQPGNKVDLINDFLSQFKEWAYKKYQVRPESPDPEHVLLRNFCRKHEGLQNLPSEVKTPPRP